MLERLQIRNKVYTEEVKVRGEKGDHRSNAKDKRLKKN